MATVGTLEKVNFTAIITERYLPAATQLGRTEAELHDALPVGREGYASEAVLCVNGIRYDSFRHSVGALEDSDLGRGGKEFTPLVTSEKIFGKATPMDEKHKLIAAADAVNPNPAPQVKEPPHIGAKSGVRATAEEKKNMSRSDRRELVRQHIDAHNINPYTNVMATDIDTFDFDMDGGAEHLTPRYGAHAGAAVSGVTRAFGGEPELQAPLTGKGGSTSVEEYFLWQAKAGNKRAVEALDGGRPVTILIQALGKAGAHHLLTLPSFVRVRGIMEYGGGIVAKGGVDDYLDASPEELLALARKTHLGKESAMRLAGAEWIEPDQLPAFWSSGAHILSPCFDRNQVTGEDAIQMSDETMVGVAIANGPFTPEAKRIMTLRGIDILPEAVANVGGTAGSRGMWEKFMYPKVWNPNYFMSKWEQRMRTISRLAFSRTDKERALRGPLVSIPEATDLIYLEQVFQRLDARS